MAITVVILVMLIYNIWSKNLLAFQWNFKLLGCMSYPTHRQYHLRQTLNVKSYVLMDFDSGMILASSNKGDLTLPPASITKMMTAYLAFTELKEKNISQ